MWGKYAPSPLDRYSGPGDWGWTESSHHDDRTRDPTPDVDALVRALRSQLGGRQYESIRQMDGCMSELVHPLGLGSAAR